MPDAVAMSLPMGNTGNRSKWIASTTEIIIMLVWKSALLLLLAVAMADAVLPLHNIVVPALGGSLLHTVVPMPLLER